MMWKEQNLEVDIVHGWFIEGGDSTVYWRLFCL